MRDRAAEGALATAALDVDVDPLAVAGQLREGVDHLLRHLELAAEGAELLADPRLERGHVVELDLFHGWFLFSSGVSVAVAVDHRALFFQPLARGLAQGRDLHLLVPV